VVLLHGAVDMLPNTAELLARPGLRRLAASSRIAPQGSRL
jgi:hypothetical protein